MVHLNCELSSIVFRPKLYVSLFITKANGKFLKKEVFRHKLVYFVIIIFPLITSIKIKLVPIIRSFILKLLSPSKILNIRFI